jgi:hypothetical protein
MGRPDLGVLASVLGEEAAQHGGDRLAAGQGVGAAELVQRLGKVFRQLNAQDRRGLVLGLRPTEKNPGFAFDDLMQTQRHCPWTPCLHPFGPPPRPYEIS